MNRYSTSPCRRTGCNFLNTTACTVSWCLILITCAVASCNIACCGHSPTTICRRTRITCGIITIRAITTITTCRTRCAVSTATNLVTTLCGQCTYRRTPCCCTGCGLGQCTTITITADAAIGFGFFTIAVRIPTCARHIAISTG